jgi:hypothetical protein
LSRVRTLPAVAFVVVLVAAASAHALDVRQLEVTRVKQRYHVEAVSEITVPPEVAFAILTDYGSLGELDSKVIESRLLERPEPNVALVWMRVRACVTFVCRELEQVERVEEHPNDEIRIEVLPERSDVKVDNAHWRFEATENGTLLSYTLDIEPGGWVPVFGRGFVERQLRSSYRDALAAVERLGRARMASAQ